MNIKSLIKWAKDEELAIDNKIFKYQPKFMNNIGCYFKMIREQGGEIIKLEEEIQKRNKNICDAITYFRDHDVKIPDYLIEKPLNVTK